MGSYNLDELITLWEREKLTTEQAVGQILLILGSLSQRIRELERRWWRQEQSDNATTTK
ncbi:MAG: hypothetical protein Kow0063_32710 [Anaerolineae bacterium]